MHARRMLAGLQHLRYLAFILLLIVSIGGGQIDNSPAADNFTALPWSGNDMSSASVAREYVVFSGNTTKQTQNLRYNLQHFLGAHNVPEYGGRYSGPQFWLVKMNDYQVGRVMTNSPGVSTISFLPEALNDQP